MSKLINETGNRYGRLTVIERNGKDKFGSIKWRCNCDCGNETITSGPNLRKNHTKSCGCLRKEKVRKIGKAHALLAGEASFNVLINNLKQAAKRRNFEWFLTKDQVRILTKQNCHYCGIEPQQKIIHSHYCNGSYIYNGLDRVDNAKGYTIDNVIPCCGTCNYAKRKMTVEQFKKWLVRIHRHFIEKSNGINPLL